MIKRFFSNLSWSIVWILSEFPKILWHEFKNNYLFQAWRKMEVQIDNMPGLRKKNYMSHDFSRLKHSTTYTSADILRAQQDFKAQAAIKQKPTGMKSLVLAEQRIKQRNKKIPIYIGARMVCSDRKLMGRFSG